MDEKKKKELAIRSSAAEYLTFVASTGESDASYEMRYEDENIWLTQKMMATLYDVSKQTISQHIKRIYADGELAPEATVKKYLTVQTEGDRQISRKQDHYNLQMIIAVGFKVNNQRAVQFRKWAGQIVKDHTIQGWTMDVDRLKKGHMFTDEYFERQLQQIREIRLSERKFYQKVTTWENAPDGKILKADVTVAKNYLSKEEMNYLERIVSLYLDYAELQAERKIPMSMEDWAKRLDGFLEFNGNELLTGPGKISAEQAKLHAETEYEKYRVIQDRLYESDFDRFLMLEQEVNHKDEV